MQDERAARQTGRQADRQARADSSDSVVAATTAAIAATVTRRPIRIVGESDPRHPRERALSSP
jgi:hypothetical protein